MALKFNQPIVAMQAPSGGEQVVVNQPNIIFAADRAGQAGQSIPTGVSTKVAMNQEQIDFGGYYDPVLFEWTPPIGIYDMRVNAAILLLGNADTFIVKIMKNGTPIYVSSVVASANNLNPIIGTSGQVSSLAGADVFTMEVEHDAAGALNLSSDINATYMYGTLHTQSLEA